MRSMQYVQYVTFSIPLEHHDQAWPTNEMWNHMDTTFSGRKLVGSKRRDTDLGKFIPKHGLNIATADKFAKQNGVKNYNNYWKQKTTQMKT